jgi:hypothetical protein
MSGQLPSIQLSTTQSCETKQATAVIFRTRDVLIGQRTQIINALPSRRPPHRKRLMILAIRNFAQ